MEELLGRRVPWSAEAEQAVLGSCLIDPSCLPDVMTAVRGADFYLPQNREIFETIFSMFTFAKPIDPVTVLDEMKVRGVYHDESSQQYIRELMRLTPTAANVLKYAAIVISAPNTFEYFEAKFVIMSVSVAVIVLPKMIFSFTP